MPRIFISPAFRSPDKADGGIRRVVEAQTKYLPEFGYTLVDSVAEADIVAVHAGAAVDVPVAKPLVAHCHGLYWEGYDWHRWHYLLNKQVIDVLLKADAVTSPSHWVDQALRRNFYLESTVLWHGVELDEWPAPASDDESDGYVLWNKARLDAVCDPTPVRELAKRAVTTEFVTTFDSGAASEGANNVRTVPPHSYDAARRLVQRAGVYLCTTRETFGIGTLEAMASEVPILGWNFGGQAEFVRHKETGWLAPVGDYDSLAEGLAYCLKNRAVLGRAARADVMERFRWRNVIERYAKLYDATLANTSRTSKAPRTSVIITNYNLAQYLPRAIDSVLVQTDQDFEIVLIDDASTGDGEREAARAQGTRDARIHLTQHEKNLYLAESLNDGLAHARGRYILPLDADNEIAPNTLQILGDHLDGSREHDIAYGAVEFVREFGTDEASADPTETEQRFISTWPPSEFDFRAQLAHKNQIPSTALYRRCIAERVGGYRPRCRTAEDADFWCRATSFGARPVKVTDAVTLIYHDRPDSMSHVNSDWPWDAWYTWGRRWELTPPGAPLAAIESAGRGVLHAADPLVSIVIPVGPGHERSVIDALDSIQAQTLTSWECIVVDASGKLDWMHPWAIRVAGALAGPIGPAKARNLGMSLARGRYFLFLDADDYLEPEALERMVTVALRSDPKDFIYTDWIIDEERRTVASNEWEPKSLLRKLDYPVTALYPIAAWKDSGGFDESYTVAWEDWDYALRIANAGYCGLHLPEALLHYRMSLGTRREAGFSRRDELKSIVYEKWKPYIEGQKELMACGSCGKRSAATPPALRGASSYRGVGANAAAPASVSPDAVLLEYIGENVGPLTFIGKATGTKYRFGLDADHRVRYVRGADVQGLLAFGDSFKIAEGATTPALVTA